VETVSAGFIDSTRIKENPEALKRRAEEEGYLYFRQLLPKDVLLKLRLQILSICKSYGWIEENTALGDGIGNLENIRRLFDRAGAKRGVGVSLEAYADVQRLELFHSLAHHPNLMSIYRRLLGAEALPHPRNIARVMLPDPGLAPTPPHQDFIHIQGTTKVWTCWFPLGDCPRELGGLAILRGSHKSGLLPVKEADGAGGLESWLCSTDYEWLEHDYEMGDVLTFSSYTVHKALPNTMGNRIRLSCDYRYQNAREAIERKSLEPHYQVTTWEDIYRNWQSDLLKFYWRKKNFSFSEWDESIRWQKQDICGD
jgi:hypothetical protein